jgi:hypothetical protein
MCLTKDMTDNYLSNMLENGDTTFLEYMKELDKTGYNMNNKIYIKNICIINHNDNKYNY